MPNRKAQVEKLLPHLPQQHRFLYHSVSQLLRDRIESRTYPPGTKIPTVEELAADFEVSTITVRRALRDLSMEGLLIARQGLGVFVANSRRIVRRLTPDHIAPFEDDMKRAGVVPGIRDLAMGYVPSEEEPVLRATRGSRAGIFRIERILLADGSPIALDTIWLPKNLAERFRTDLKGRFIVTLLETHGVICDHIDYRFESSTANENQAQKLNLVVGFPLLIIRLVPIGQNGVPILVGRTTARADRFCYEFCAHRRAHRNKN
jgi:GntR family transcriptional regulator